MAGDRGNISGYFNLSFSNLGQFPQSHCRITICVMHNRICLYVYIISNVSKVLFMLPSKKQLCSCVTFVAGLNDDPPETGNLEKGKVEALYEYVQNGNPDKAVI